jgi:hypothetical protein
VVAQLAASRKGLSSTELTLFAGPSVTKEFPDVVCYPKFNYLVHKNPPLVPILSEMNPLHITSAYFTNILISILPSVSRSSWWYLFFWISY